MAGFKFYTVSADGKLKGLVSADYVRGRMINRTIEGMGTKADGSYLEVYLSDGAAVNFALAGLDGPEIQYRAPQK
ncbi:MAG TPA: hypothetical protein VHL50_07710 [Pyrinomonadaceae bacterium]|nr:hypothetical protein [Pyrinomonadaceae bacterium]